MKSLKTLIKIAGYDLDDLRQKLKEKQDSKDEIIRQRKNLKSMLIEEQKVALANENANRAYAAYAKSVALKQEKLLKDESVFDQDIEELSLKISEAFGELKKYEIMLENKQQEEKAQLLSKQQFELDEMALSGHLRKENNSD